MHAACSCTLGNAFHHIRLHFTQLHDCAFPRMSCHCISLHVPHSASRCIQVHWPTFMLKVLHSLALTCILVYLHFTASLLHRVQCMQTHAGAFECISGEFQCIPSPLHADRMPTHADASQRIAIAPHPERIANASQRIASACLVPYGALRCS